MKKILFIALTENETMRGVERYCYETLRYLRCYNELDITVLKGKWQNYYDDLKEDRNIKFLDYDGNNSKISRHLYLITQIKSLSKDFDIIHYGNTMPYIIRNNCYTIMTIHDIAEYFVPEKYSFLQLIYRKIIVKISAKLVDKIVTVSNFSKFSLVEYLKVNREKILVTYNGVEHFRSSYKTKSFTKENKIVYFGVIEDSKGIQELIYAFKNSKCYESYQLLLIGKKGNAYSKVQSHIDNIKIIYLGFIDDNKLKEIILNSSLVVYPSKYEGFGLPALEAFCLNDNILTSNLTSLGEVTKDFAWQVNPSNFKEFSTVLDNALNKPKHFTNKEKEKNLSKFSWKNSAEILKKEYINSI